MKSLATKNPALEKPKLSTESNEPLLLEAPDNSETPIDFVSDQVAPLKKVSKPKAEKPIKDSLDVVTSEKLENISDLERVELYKKLKVSGQNINQIPYLDDEELNQLVDFLKSLSYINNQNK